MEQGCFSCKFVKGAVGISAFLLFCASVARLLYWIINEASGAGIAMFAILSMLIWMGYWLVRAELENVSERREEA